MLNQPQLNKLPFNGLPRLGTGGAPSSFQPLPQQQLTPQPNPNNYPFAQGTQTIRNTNPFTQQHNKMQREQQDYLQQNAALDPTLRAELEKFGDYYKRYYMSLLQAGGQPNEKGETPASQYLDFLRANRDQRMQKWVDVWNHLDADTKQGFDRFQRPEFKEAYIDAMVAGAETVYLNVDGKDVPMRGYDAAREIYRRAIEFAGQERDRKKGEWMEQANQAPYRMTSGGY
jgi:hypothetical protein